MLSAALVNKGNEPVASSIAFLPRRQTPLTAGLIQFRTRNTSGVTRTDQNGACNLRNRFTLDTLHTVSVLTMPAHQTPAPESSRSVMERRRQICTPGSDMCGCRLDADRDKERPDLGILRRPSAGRRGIAGLLPGSA
jgi:hypothetical protein